MKLDITQDLDTLSDMLHNKQIPWERYMERVQLLLERRAFFQGPDLVDKYGTIQNLLIVRTADRRKGS